MDDTHRIKNNGYHDLIIDVDQTRGVIFISQHGRPDRATIVVSNPAIYQLCAIMMAGRRG